MKILISLLLATMLTYASYSNMQSYYTQGAYSSVLTEAKRSGSEYQNPKLHLLWAKAAQKLGKTTVAMSAYERVLILEPEHKEAQDGLATIYDDTHREGLTLNPYEELSSNTIKITTSLSLGHDTNINVNPSGTALDGYYGVEVDAGEISTNFARVVADISYAYHFENLEDWFIQSTLSLYHQSNFSAHFYDLSVPTLTLAMGYQPDSYLVHFPLSYSRIDYLDKHLLDQLVFAPKIRLNILENSLLDLGLLYEDRNYKDAIDTNKDSTSIGAEVGIYFATDTIRTHFNAKYEKRTAKNSSDERYIDANFITLNADAKYYFTPFISAEGQYLFGYADYTEDIGTKATPSSISRDDYINQATIKMTYAFNKNVEVYARDTYTDSLSTYIPTQYNKNELMLGIKVRY